MGVLLRDANVRFEECHTAWLNEREFVEIARTLKTMAKELGLETDPVINELVHFGVDAAFAMLAVLPDLKSRPATSRPGAGIAAKPVGVPSVQ
ncbi:hypothetical protein MTR62_05315 [Novosphingobium sp. 1949]|uniref:Uncharacterized protein n=1 Tax=Novosphingobium organovorum TaxID=2930092 RepID=A0ABT0BAZ6_9SPHN|nr:hypothetical protein [Novosphingobium organovorum]MCJ2182124.1 hypothetical protein [Novosphingobium organovorum]